jgi:hypothetical protein
MGINKSGPRFKYKSRDTACLMCDAQVKEARRLHEEEGETMKALAVQFSVKESYMKSVLEYQIRSNVH